MFAFAAWWRQHRGGGLECQHSGEGIKGGWFVMTAPPVADRARPCGARPEITVGRHRTGAESPGPVLKDIRASQTVTQPALWSPGLTVTVIVQAGASANGGDDCGQAR